MNMNNYTLRRSIPSTSLEEWFGKVKSSNVAATMPPYLFAHFHRSQMCFAHEKFVKMIQIFALLNIKEV